MPQSSVPRVSVITATRNRPTLLLRSLQSIAAQTYSDYEVVVVDDGSEPAVHEQYAKMWDGLGARFILYPARPAGSAGSGPSAARNKGAKRACGQFLAFLDDDDIWTDPSHLAVAVPLMERLQADYYFANMRGVSSQGVIIPDWYPHSPSLKSGARVNDTPPVYEVPLDAFLCVMRHHFVHPVNSIVRREVFQRIGGFFEQVSFGEDRELMLQIADRANRILYRPECIVDYRLPEGDSISLKFTRLEQYLQHVIACQHVRLTCGRTGVRRCARSQEGWSLRELAQQTIAQNRRQTALSFAWQSVCVYPTLGAIAFLLRAFWGASFAFFNPGRDELV